MSFRNSIITIHIQLGFADTYDRMVTDGEDEFPPQQ
jgi:hypothetical protein